MSLSLGGWSILGIGAAVAIVAGIVLLVAYALQRGLVHRELDGVDPEGGPDAMPAAKAPANRTLGTIGAIVLVVGLALGLLSALAGWGGTGTTGTGPGADPDDCAQSWSGCPQATPAP
ncbi:MAG: hypothetical protein A2V85_06600 [Chloroflexi bacterium RBG_16_72_14]|nr:MAG: hypothetical protein A2V85_06600 [Chloroflexi bacterium RBG_16_72_14]